MGMFHRFSVARERMRSIQRTNKLFLTRTRAKLSSRTCSTNQITEKKLFQPIRTLFVGIFNRIYATSLFSVVLSLFPTAVFATDDLQCNRLFEDGRKRDLCISASITQSKLTDEALREIVEKRITSDDADRDKEKRREALKVVLENEARKTNLLQIKLLKPGMTLKMVQELYPLAKCSEVAGTNELAECNYTSNLSTKADKTHPELETFGGHAVREWSIQFFPSDKLVSAVALMDPSAFDDVTKAIAAKFGKALSSKIEELQNGFGAKFKGRTLIWKKHGTVLEAQERASERDTMLIVIYSSAAGKAFDNIDQAKAKRSAKDL
jgi:hypothetical protein